MANKHVKRCSTSLVIKETQRRTTETTIFLMENISAGKDVEKTGILIQCRNTKLCSHCEKQFSGSSVS